MPRSHFLPRCTYSIRQTGLDEPKRDRLIKEWACILTTLWLEQCLSRSITTHDNNIIGYLCKATANDSFCISVDSQLELQCKHDAQ